MKKFLKLLALLLALSLAFLLGWRVMPHLWPSIKTAIVYPLFPQLAPTPAPVVTPAPYVPERSAALSDPIAATDSLIYYFYKDYCPYCAALEPLTAGLPTHVTLPDGTTSAVRLVCLNKNDEADAAIVTRFYADHAIPEDRQYVPAMLIGNRYMMSGVEIIDGLMDALMAGEGLNTPLLDGAARTP